VRLTLSFGIPTKWPLRRSIRQARSLASSRAQTSFTRVAILTMSSISLDDIDTSRVILRPVFWDDSCMLDSVLDLAQCHSNTLKTE